ncbi:HNH endonuclease [Arthrobacter sp. 2MCAF14]|uniref:HNH endonuclease n=1 Tax=Arthrobacter sp. 2MCAF14 TaxID=3232982 RepID=UPI003F905855
MVEIRNHATSIMGESHSQTDRRVRGLRDVYGIVVPCLWIGGAQRYVLQGLRPPGDPRRRAISGKLRARVLLSQRCAQCGKTPTQDFVKLEVDHKLPLTWGGDNDVDNLQPLCQECNNGKRDYFASLDEHSDKIRAAAAWLEPHKRIGEALKAFAEAGEAAPSQILEVIASTHQHQDDWQKRLRELKELGWNHRVQYRYENGRRRSYYELTAWSPWPDGDVAAHIRRLERLRKGSAKKNL